MKFSVVVPVYNVEQYVGACIESVLQQSFADFQLILVNDGSVDRSREICEEYALKDPRIQVFHQKNSGQYAARQKGVSKAHGEFLVFLDADDLLAPCALATIEEKLRLHNCDMVLFYAEQFKDTPPQVCKSPEPDQILETKKDLYLTIFSVEQFNSLCLKSIRRKLFNCSESNCSNDVRHGEDLLQTVLLLKKNPKTVLTHNVLYYYRENEQSVTHNLNIQRYASDTVTARKAVSDLLLEENVLLPQEMIAYKGCAIRFFSESIANIAAQKASYKQKKRALSQMRKSAYCKDFLSKGAYDKKALGNKRIVWFLFRHGFISAISFLFTLKRILH